MLLQRSHVSPEHMYLVMCCLCRVLLSQLPDVVCCILSDLQSLQANIRLSPEVVDGLRVEVNASCSSGDSPNSCTGVRQEELVRVY